MKKISIINKIIVGISTVLVGCNSFLTTDMPSFVTPEDFYTTETEVEMGLAGIYAEISHNDGYGKNLSILFDAGTDEGYYNRDENNNWTLGRYVHTPSDGDMDNTWFRLYSTINLANTFIKYLKTENFTQEQADSYLAEARFLRALSYMNLTFYWNEVPLRREPTSDVQENNIAVSSLSEIYNFIATDLLFAAENLPHAKDSDYETGRANSMAARALLARLYLKRAGAPMKDFNGYKLAKTQLDIIIEDGWHKLTLGGTDEKDNGYRNQFLSYIENEYIPTESIFEISYAYVQSSGLSVSGTIGGMNGLRYTNQTEGPYAYAMENVSVMLLNHYEEEDYRLLWNTPGISSNGETVVSVSPMKTGYTPGKYRRWEPALTIAEAISNPTAEADDIVFLENVEAFNRTNTSVNFPIVRYSDVLLMSAEADYFVNGESATSTCYDRLNAVRTRSGLAALSEGTYSGGNNNFFEEIVDERMRELCFEGIRTFDLVRWGILGERLTDLINTIETNSEYDPANSDHVAFTRGAYNYLENPEKFNSLPYPRVELSNNNLMSQKDNW